MSSSPLEIHEHEIFRDRRSRPVDEPHETCCCDRSPRRQGAGTRRWRRKSASAGRSASSLTSSFLRTKFFCINEIAFF
jgi:hypothetical protein